MGLTLYYDWKHKCRIDEARQLIRRMHGLATQLPFDEVSEIFEQTPPGEPVFTPYPADSYSHASLCLPRKRPDGLIEHVQVPSTHAVFFVAHVAGAETMAFGLAAHPAVVTYREDVVEFDEQSRERGRLLRAGAIVEFNTRRRGFYSWHSFCKTQYAGNPKLGGEANFLRAHLSLIEMLDQIEELGLKVAIRDDSGYAKHRDVSQLVDSLREWNGVVAGFAGRLGDALEAEGLSMQAPIKERPDFEHLEAQGFDVLNQIIRRQQGRNH